MESLAQLVELQSGIKSGAWQIKTQIPDTGCGFIAETAASGRPCGYQPAQIQSSGGDEARKQLV